MRKKVEKHKESETYDLLAEFFNRLDRKVSHRIQAFLIGGAGLILGYGIPRVTADVDVLETKETRELRQIFEASRGEFRDLGLELQLIPPEWFPLPEDYKKEAQLVPVRGLKNLELRTLRAEDLLLVKLSRGSSKDLEDIRWLVREGGVHPERLLERYREGRKYLPAGGARMDSAFLHLMDDFFTRKLKLEDLD